MWEVFFLLRSSEGFNSAIVEIVHIDNSYATIILG